MRVQLRLAFLTVVLLAISASLMSGAETFPAGTFVNGDWAVTFSADKTYHVAQNGETVVEGVYTVGKDSVSFEDKQGRYLCNDSDGKYTWTLKGASLTFVKLDDQCEGRVGVLTNGPLVRQEQK